MTKLKYSRQRESIKEFLATRTDHPTADIIYMNIKEIYPNLLAAHLHQPVEHQPTVTYPKNEADTLDERSKPRILNNELTPNNNPKKPTTHTATRIPAE